MSSEEIRRDINKRIKWWQSSFERPDGRVSGNMLTLFMVVVMCVITWACALFGGYIISDNLLILLGIMGVMGIFATGFFSREVVKSIAAALAGQPYVADTTNINIQNREGKEVKDPTNYGKIDNIDG